MFRVSRNTPQRNHDMAMQGEPASREWMCLRQSFRETFPWNHQDLTRDGFRKWARTKREPAINVTAQHWRPMKVGEPVPRDMVEAFSEYVALHHMLPVNDCRLSVIADACGPPGEGKASEEGWKSLFTTFSRAFAIDDASYCRNEDDLMFAARMVMECLPVHEGLTLSGREAIAYSEGVMKRSLEEYARTLLTFWQANEHSVLFATLRRGDTVERTGVMVVVPITEDFKRRFYAGEADEATITAADLAPRSNYVLGCAVAENRAIDQRRDKMRRNWTHSRTNIYQLASLFLPVHHDAWQPHIVTFLGSSENARRLRSYNFLPVGVKTNLTGRDVVEFAPPPKEKLGMAYPIALAEYLAMRSLIQIYQAYIEAQRPHLE